MTYVDKILDDKQFGHIYIKTHSRAKRYTFRPAKDGTPERGLLVTVPVHYQVEDVLRAVEEMRPKLVEMFEQYEDERTPVSNPKIDLNFSIVSDCLHIRLVKGYGSQFTTHFEPAVTHPDEHGWLMVEKPALVEIISKADFDFDSHQEWLEKVIVEMVRRVAQQQLIPRMKLLARHYGIGLNEVKVNNSKGHWGSCSHHKKRAVGIEYFNINLSLYTLLLPMPVQRLILLHELCHTRHMDHSEVFHRELDAWLDGQEQALEERLKGFSTSVFSFVADGRAV